MGLVAYITAGDPSLEATEKIVLAAANAGADVIELGVPFSDPVADGPTIQRASDRALRSGTALAGVIDLVRNIRGYSQVPLVLFSYSIRFCRWAWKNLRLQQQPLVRMACSRPI